MKRVDEYKLIRIHKRKCVFVMLFFLLITLTGIIVSDYCINSIMKDEKKIGIFHLENGTGMNIKLVILNRVINLHYDRIYNDYEYLKRKVFN